MNLVWSHLQEKLYGVRLFVLLVSWFCHNNASKYAQVINDPENDGCINAVLLV